MIRVKSYFKNKKIQSYTAVEISAGGVPDSHPVAVAQTLHLIILCTTFEVRDQFNTSISSSCAKLLKFWTLFNTRTGIWSACTNLWYSWPVFTPSHLINLYHRRRIEYRRQGKGRRVGLGDKILAALDVFPRSFWNKRSAYQSNPTFRVIDQCLHQVIWPCTNLCSCWTICTSDHLTILEQCIHRSPYHPNPSFEVLEDAIYYTGHLTILYQPL